MYVCVDFIIVQRSSIHLQTNLGVVVRCVRQCEHKSYPIPHFCIPSLRAWVVLLCTYVCMYIYKMKGDSWLYINEWDEMAIIKSTDTPLLYVLTNKKVS